jgi:iron complex transport system ATP-binding protein
VIVARGVTVRAGRAVLVDDVSLDVAGGELLALVGPNGAGKTTLLGALAGDRCVAAGMVSLAGRAAHALPARALARTRAVLPQRSILAASFTALEVVMLGFVDPIGDEAARRAEARRLLGEVELGGFADRLYPTLSGGEQQRVHLARVLAQLGDAGGRALFLDEPTAALDPRHQHLVLGRARRAAAAGHAVVAVLHDLSLAARWADRIALLDRGRLAGCGRPEEVLRPDLLRAVFSVAFDLVPHPGGRGFLVASSAPEP